MRSTTQSSIWGKDGRAAFEKYSKAEDGPVHLIVRDTEGNQILDLCLWDGAEELLFAAVDEYRLRKVPVPDPAPPDEPIVIDDFI